MSEMRTVRGFEDVWRPPVRSRRVRPETVLAHADGRSNTRARLQRLVRKAPEVMVKVTGRARDTAHLRAHLDYVTRNGQLEAEDRDGWPLLGRDEVRSLGDCWAWSHEMDSGRRRNSALSLSLILSMPAGTDAIRLRDAARAFARDAFEGGHDYLLVLHTDTPHPHVHVTVKARGDGGQRLNPKKADLEAWRQAFARALRDRGIEAEATPRRARGVTRKAERGPIRRMRERYFAGHGVASRAFRGALADAARVAASGQPEPTEWETRTARRQAVIRGLYRAQAELLARSPDSSDRALAAALRTFVDGMLPPDTQRLGLARVLRNRDATKTRRPERNH
ncbi:MAG: hypothetical protein A2790_20000 [Phenylobacterium sp. RIFCSPHIGHO2_01_FULL_69_31]|uniref:relaxase/mobilization nuclease domain-containing protein n=1 Tax=Phenylobacterium sp. RIFCSPHIGHO2_01_FULL_69_31 TaxID=1801944 RepID=UPI0008B133CE|nr:relaxase/mobilization nuclease domain-containing protein [Phenylobacterium sp. RIFCSPHIGHO2_01_FULL_69_31]OHB26326.1 MAG: hypothetical protein A2790_20000 [Phenylobacterium sp. RIFCSPHIGHO2_01_FULL_69_31]